MSPQNGPWLSTPTWAPGYQARRRGPANPNLRVSDADRADVADRLSKHYGDGRLDQSEFNDRMERAMNAKTQGDFAGLFDDLPDLSHPDGQAVEPAVGQPVRSHGFMYRIAMLVLLIVAAIAVTHVLSAWFFPWVLIALVAFLWLRHHERTHHHQA